MLLSVLLGIELFGFVGALLAVPLAGAATVVTKEAWRHRPQQDALIVVEAASRSPKRSWTPPTEAQVELFTRGLRRVYPTR